jgi:hypothetical protein
VLSLRVARVATVLFLSNVCKAQTSMFSATTVEQPKSVQFGGSLAQMSCYETN